jgi:hypothetical protein
MKPLPKLLLAAAVAGLGLQAAYADTLSGAVTANLGYGFDNCYFDIQTAATSVRIDSFQIYAYQQNFMLHYRIYTHPGTRVGTETNDGSAWTLVGTAAVTTPATCRTVAFALPIPVGVVIPANSTSAFVILTEEDGDNYGGILQGSSGVLSDAYLTVPLDMGASRATGAGYFQPTIFSGGSTTLGFGGTITYTVNPVLGVPPNITTQPAPTTTVNERDNFSLTVVATGDAPLHYQWRKDGVSLAGATNATYTKAAATSDSGSYTVVVTNAFAPPATSHVAQVTVIPLPPVYTTTISGARYGGGAFDNNYFDIISATKPVRVDSFAIYSFTPNQLLHYRIYTHPGTYVGTETNDGSAWTLVGAAAVTTPKQTTTAFTLPIYVGVVIPTNSTQAFVILTEEDGDVYGGVFEGDSGVLSNADLTVSIAYANSRPAGGGAAGYFQPTCGNCLAPYQLNKGFGGTITYTVNPYVGPPLITTQPAPTTTVNERDNLSLTVAVDGSGPFSYQWRTNGVNIPGAINSTYSKQAVPNDSGNYTIVVTGAIAPPATSTVAQVTVIADTNAPTVVSTLPVALQAVTLTFSEPMEITRATNAANYTLSSGGTVLSAALNSAGTVVTLGVANLSLATAYTLTISNLIDRAVAANPLRNGTQTQFTTWRYSEQIAAVGFGSAWDNFYFNITVGAQPIIIHRFVVDSFVQPPTEMLVFLCSTYYDGNEHDASKWTMVSSNHFEAFGGGTHLSLPVGDIALAAGTQRGFLICDNSSNDAGVYGGVGAITGADFSVDTGHMMSGSSGEGVFARTIDAGGGAIGAPGFGGVIDYCVSSCLPKPAAPVLAVQARAGGLDLSWVGSGFMLQRSPGLPATNWTDVGQNSPQQVTSGGTAQFYRLVTP